ncbi:MAG: hypothetical protein NDJ89_04815 [Oligoflexia bacterium]|nr:hypothetical protein [Oligoflexia bacterium]
MQTMERRKFILRFLLGAPVLLGMSRLLSACGRTDESDIAGYLGLGCDGKSVSVSITTSHSHTLTVSIEDVSAGVEKTYTMTGSHPHSVTLTAEHFATLRAGGTVSLVSTGGGGGNHTHATKFVCA